MTVLAVSPPGEIATRYSLRVASDGPDVRAAQRLRYLVFAEELGAVLHSPAAGLDIDEFDAHCDHLVIAEETTGAVVGTYRMLPPHRVAQTGRCYTEGEFDLSALSSVRGELVEAGRACVHPDHRTGAVINLMWTGIARYLHLIGHRWLAGCVSIPLTDGGATARGVWDLVRARHLSPVGLRVTPLRPWAVAADPAAAGRVALPPLLRGYLRLGAWVCGPPAHDPDFGVADLFVLLSLDRVDPRYLRHFLDAP